MSTTAEFSMVSLFGLFIMFSVSKWSKLQTPIRWRLSYQGLAEHEAHRDPAGTESARIPGSFTTPAVTWAMIQSVTTAALVPPRCESIWLTRARSGDAQYGAHSPVRAYQLIGLAPAIVMRTLASSCASFVTPPEQSLTKKTSKPSLRAARTDWTRHTSVTRPAITSFLRPVASTAARTSGCDQACDEGRSIGVLSGKASVISLKRGSTSTLPWAPTVVSTVGTPNAFATCERAATLLTRRPRSMERTLMATAGWWSMSTRTEVSIVSSFGLFVMSRSPFQSGRRGCSSPLPVMEGLPGTATRDSRTARDTGTGPRGQNRDTRPAGRSADA